MPISPMTEERTGIQSIEVGMPLLTALARQGTAMSLTSLASAAGMSASKAHKYLISFVRIGLARQEASAGLYDLGPLALEFGLAALHRIDVVGLAHATMSALQARIDETVTLTIWSSLGPTTVQVVENRRPVTITVKLGGALPLLTSSNGHVFLSWLDRAQTRALMEAELRDAKGPAHRAGLRSEADVEALVQATRRRGVAEVRGLVMPGIYAYSAPVWSMSGLVAALTVVGMMGEPHPSSEKIPDLLSEAAHHLSRQLGSNGRSPGAQ